MINFQKGVQDSQLKSTIDYRINRQFQVVSKSREIRQTQSQCQNKVAINNNNYIKPKRSIQYNSIQTDSTAFESLETDQRRQSTEPRNYQKRRSRIISTKIQSQIDLLQSCDMDHLESEQIPIGNFQIQQQQYSEPPKNCFINKENYQGRRTKLPTLKKHQLQFEKNEGKISGSNVVKFGESFVTPFFGTKKPISLEKRPNEFQGLVYKRKK
ncbi:unnamed protein product [Paramecium pentaurelia]|uniref:Uncharacterized protein n=1 Tax=Paramecium pentaurelia TaxID=43138 RepID=A0A8S1XJQ1_9CILI|nr:unnamed protein product [Paramecium pentaurelia]